MSAVHKPRYPVSRLAVKAMLILFLATVLAILLTREGAAQSEEPEPLISLRKVPRPGPTAEELSALLQDRKAAIQLGKALFWDTRVGSDNRTACATCHFHAGSDSRSRNMLNPGLLAGDRTFQLGGPNYQLKAADFPFTRHAQINDPASRVADRNDVVSSPGVLTNVFNSTGGPGKPDNCSTVSDAVNHGGSGFNLDGVNTRRVEPRNAPTVINSIFNLRNFWDGRANNTFNGVDPFGPRNGAAQVWKQVHGVLRQAPVALSFSSLASLASGPPVSENEMSCRGRVLANLGRKLIDSPLLADQTIADDDSVLGPLSRSELNYGALIRKAFRPEYWQASARIDIAGAPAAASVDLAPSATAYGARPVPKRDSLSQMEANFALFFGLAIQMYQSTLVSDDTPFDRYAAGDRNALRSQQVRGLNLFRGKADCIHCHVGAELSSASVSNALGEGRLDSRLGIGNAVFRYDNGFFNTGVRPTADDPGVGATDPFGFPLAETRISQIGRTDLLGAGFDPAREVPVPSGALTAVDGALKTPGLRNVEFTGPYFHNGGKATLMQVVDFYNIGGDFGLDNRPITDPAVRPLGLSQSEKQDLVAFLLSLSDDRVRFRRAPFDHPSLCLPNGHATGHGGLRTDDKGNAIDLMKCLPAVGRRGAESGLGTFLGLDPYSR